MVYIFAIGTFCVFTKTGRTKGSGNTVCMPLSILTFCFQNSVPSFCFVSQIAFIYIFTALHKSSSAWSFSGDALYQVFSTRHCATSMAGYFLRFPGVLSIMTGLVRPLQFAGGLLLLSPWRRTACRNIAVSLLMVLHAGLALCLHLGLSFFAFPAALLALLPGGFWDTLLPW